MCGIAGYVGPKNAVDVVFDQLKRLEYRGYDSAGIAYRNNGEIKVVKRAGKLTELGKLLGEKPLSAHMAIAHSRWATHGGPTDINAHPHYDAYEQVAIIHNGIIENYQDLREELIEEGHIFQSQTDTEVAAHIIGDEYKEGVPLEEAVGKAVRRLRGAYAMVIVSKREDGKIVAVRNSSPLVIGLGEGENLLASDIPALLPYTREVVVLEENDLAVLTKDSVRILDRELKERPLRPQHIEWDIAAAERGGYEHFMRKEIHEQPQVINQSLAGRIDELGHIRLERVFSEHVWSDIDRIHVIACGTAYHAGLMGKYLFEDQLRLPTEVHYSSEFRYCDPILSPNALAVFISQSGETLDTISALRLCKDRRIRTLGIVNVVGSTIARECDRTIFTQAGPEISVASTKAYTAQVMVLTLLGLYIAQVRETAGIRVDEWVEELWALSKNAEKCLELEDEIIALCEKIKDMPLCFFLGRRADSYVALEGALKLKEIAYIPTQESPAGEMKHGPLALIQKGVVSVFGATDPAIVEKVVSNMKEVQARGGTVVAVTVAEQAKIGAAADYVLEVPKTRFPFLNAVLSAIPLQLLAYHIARLNGCEIDQPRNLAKSVTVE